MKIVLATSNSGKLKELATLLTGNTIIPQSDLNITDAEETGLTFVENALIKARHASEKSQLPAIADDSGLVVDALKGAPGIYSARYAGSDKNDQANYEKVLHELRDVKQSSRTARFICCLVMLRHENDPLPIICHGIWEGSILFEPQGCQGFGYDPIFYSPEYDCSAAQLSKTQKTEVSHRGKALRQLQQQIKNYFN